MATYFLGEGDFHGFLSGLMAELPVIGPVAKTNGYVFEELRSPGELRLDYDVTLLPPKAVFFPPNQKLLEFSEGRAKSCIAPRRQVLFGVHLYDVKALDMLDRLFAENFRDENYLANRESTIIVATHVQVVGKRAFWASVGTELKAQGHDAYLTRIDGGYVLAITTPKGDQLLSCGNFVAANEKQVALAARVNESPGECPEKLEHSSREIGEKVRASFKNDDLWNMLAKDCFSCGACNLVCPTCYCFDVQDTWNLDQTSGSRCRNWDGCMLEDFSKVSLGGGHSENFRENRGQRFRHRVMRKTAYLNLKLGGPACVGCGRCTSACVPDIADPVKIINRIMLEG